MKKQILSLFFIFSFFSASSAAALDLYAMGSYWSPDDSDSVWGLGIGASSPIIIDQLRLDGRAYFFEDSNYGRSGDIEMIPLDLGLQLHLFPGSELNSYLQGGISYIYTDDSDLDVDSEFGGYLGVGLELPTSEHLKIFGEVNWRIAELDSETLREDINISGLTTNVGLKLHF